MGRLLDQVRPHGLQLRARHTIRGDDVRAQVASTQDMDHTLMRMPVQVQGHRLDNEPQIAN